MPKGPFSDLILYEIQVVIPDITCQTGAITDDHLNLLYCRCPHADPAMVLAMKAKIAAMPEL